MLSREYKLKKDNDFRKVFEKGEYYQEGFINLKLLANSLGISRFAFVTGLKVSKKAVERNRLKRQLEEAVRLNLEKIKPGFDIVVRVRPEIKEQERQQIEDNLLSLFKKAKLLK